MISDAGRSVGSLTDEVVTASAYVLHRGRFVFAFGFPGEAHDRLGVARLGGHREPGERAWACAAREVLEESTLTIRPLAPPATYWIGPGGDETTIAAALWDGDAAEPVPLLVGWRGESGARKLSVTYLAAGEGEPAPAA